MVQISRYFSDEKRRMVGALVQGMCSLLPETVTDDR
jgi:hypothetical protein